MVAKTALVKAEFFLYCKAGAKLPRVSAFQTHSTPPCVCVCVLCMWWGQEVEGVNDDAARQTNRDENETSSIGYVSVTIYPTYLPTYLPTNLIARNQSRAQGLPNGEGDGRRVHHGLGHLPTYLPTLSPVINRVPRGFQMAKEMGEECTTVLEYMEVMEEEDSCHTQDQIAPVGRLVGR